MGNSFGNKAFKEKAKDIITDQEKIHKEQEQEQEQNHRNSQEKDPKDTKDTKNATCQDKKDRGKEEERATATLAGGCFWGLELTYQRVPGVVKTTVGYTGGTKGNPTYREVCSGNTGHTEGVQIFFNPSIITYEEILLIFWDRIDPTTLNSQGNDYGTQYRSGIYYHDEKQKEIAILSVKEEQKNHLAPIVTEVREATTFYPAEDYHQQYLEKKGQSATKGDITPIRCYG